MADKEINALSNEEIVVQGETKLRRSIAHLPAFYRTDTNHRFLSSTIDPLIQKGSLERLDGWVGKLDAYTRQASDVYIPAITEDRKAYQLDPAVTYTDQDTSSTNPEDRVKFTGTYDDYINQLKYFGAPVDNHDRLNKEVTYSWNPAVDMDKLINYREYYWLPEGPGAILIDVVGSNASTEIDVGVVTHDGSTVRAYVFGNKPTEQNSKLILYRGNTYKFIIGATGHPFWIMTEPYRSGLSADGSTSTIYTSGVTNAGTDSGTVTFTIPTDAPDVLYYQCGNHDSMHGILQIDTISSTTKINVENEIKNTKNYSLRTLNLSNGMKIKFGSNVTDETTYKDKEFYVEGVGDAITLTNVENLITPESYATETTILYDSVAYDSRPYAKAFYRPETKDYITIKRDSRDQNAWSRYNRWFHRSVIETISSINGYTPVLNETDRAKRPIIEFDSGLALYNHGTVAKNSVTLVDTVTTDAFSTVVGSTGYIIDGLSLSDGMRVVFLSDTDTTVKNKIYTVNFVSGGGSALSIALTEASDGTPANDESIFVEFGTVGQGKTYYYDSSTTVWGLGQTKTAVNQQPLFGLWDDNEIAFNNTTTYPSTSFTGAKIFNYKISSTATTDTVLGLKVKYNTINNVGDIVFETDATASTFTYKSNEVEYTRSYASGHLHYTTGAYTHNNKSTWLKRTNESKQRVVRTVIVDALEKQLFPIDFYKESISITDLEILVVVNGAKKVLTTDYTLVDGTTNKYIKFVKALTVGDQIKILGYSTTKKVLEKGIYEIPENLSVNSLNSVLGEFSYGQISNHVKDIVEKNSDVIGIFPGSSNLRDVPDTKLKGGTIQQHTGSLVPAIFGLIDQNANLISALDYANVEYQKFYDSFLTHAMSTAYEGVVADRVDEILIAIGQGKTNTFSFYYEDMVGYGENHSLRKYTVQDSSETEYAIDSLQDMTTPSNRAVYVYKNDVQLILDTDYTISTVDDSINVTSTLVAGDIIKIKDYSNTTGSFIPPTPTKLGIYPKFVPENVTDNTYVTSISVIVGHDGSRRKAYGDYRDDLILELEKRIYNNIKTAYDSTLLDPNDIIPSAFKSTEYTINEVDGVLGPDFYTWAGKHGVQYITNTTYNADNTFTWNYSSSTDILNAEKMPGHWRGIYNYFYDTDRPHTHPWEIAGHSEKPSNWETLYGTAPYTSGNTVMWEALAATTGRYAKTNLTNYIPVDASGNLLDPLGAKIIKSFDLPNKNADWKFGDQAPAETAWRRSSAYPFSVTKLMALCKPAKFFGLFLDNSRLTKNISKNLIDKDTNIRQKLSTAKYHLENINSVRQMTSGYQPWIVNYLISRNLDPATFFYNKMKQLNVQLAYKLGGFTDKNNIKVLTNSTSPGSTAGSQFIPDENYKILFRTSNPVNSFNYSGILIELNTDISVDGSTLAGGYKVLGYNTIKPFFKFYKPIKSTSTSTIESTDVRVLAYPRYESTLTTITYGHVFDTIQEVADFILGYGKYLEAEGFTFDKFSGQLKEIINWRTSVKEFLYWTTQGWAAGSAITISAGADGFTLDTKNSVVGQLKNLTGSYTVLDSTGKTIETNKISTKRLGKTFDLSIKDEETGLYNIALNTVQKEHILIFDNKTVFSDILFDPITGFRQERLKIVGWKTAGWNGDYHAPGFVFDAAQVSYWIQNTDYKIGDTIEYQSKFYVSKTNHNSESTFVTSKWMLKDKKPVPQLIPSFDYKIAQFNDFYNLETNNFDESQQSLAQHLIGYQSRDYLENLFVNDISQYKFYQGYIREKGTQNAINKLLKAKFEDEDINIDLYPEWMIRKGEFGNANATENIQVALDDTKFTSHNQSIELLNNSNDSVNWTRSVPVIQNNFYTSPIEYTASTTFAKYDYSIEGVSRDVVQIYKTAGYPKLSQVQHTAYNVNDLLNLDVDSLQANDLIWIANKTNNDWDVQRVTPAGIKVATLKSINDATQLEVTFTGSHTFSAGTTTTTADYMAIANAQSSELNSVYEIKEVINSNTVAIDYVGALGFIPELEDESTVSTYGNIYKFVSVRLASIDNVNDNLSYSEYRDLNSSINLEGDKVYADNNSASLWKVYEKHDPYTTVQRLSPDTATADQDFGYRIIARKDGRTVVISAPTKGQGTVHFMFRREVTAGNTFESQSSVTMTENNDGTSKLGYSLSMSTDENFVVAGAPYTNTIGSDGSTRFNDSGLIKMFVWDPLAFKYGILNTITAPTDEASQNFGMAHKICEPGVSAVRSTPTKYLFVSAPGVNSNAGAVYMYEWGIGADGSTYDTWTQNLTITSDDPGSNKRFGQTLEVNDNGDILAIQSRAPGQAGKVEIFARTSQSSDDSVQHSFTLVQTLTGISADGSSLNRGFGSSLAMTKDGTTLIIGAPGADKTDQEDAGAIYYYKWNADGSTNTYTLQQTIEAPDGQTNMQFGSSLDITETGKRLIIGAEKFDNRYEINFDLGATTFDLQDTKIVDSNIGSGGAYTATMYDTKYVIDDRLVTSNVSANDDFGKGVCIIDQTVFVGAPDDDGNVTADGSTKVSNDGTVTTFDLTKNDIYAWKEIASETALINEERIGSAFIFDSRTNKIIDYLNLYDPVKGRILGIADREINIKTAWDPATYNFGSVANLKTPWGEEHIGETWWDLSKVKWIWYEQGDQEFKTNNWGKIFPGSSIDIYEWIETTLLPSQWNSSSTSVDGAALGISGTPHSTDDTKYTVKQKYDSQLDGYVNYYYYWVKNSAFLPQNSVVERKNTTFYISNIITNPFTSGTKYFSITDTNKLIVNNVKNNLVNNDIILSVDYKTNIIDAEPHSVWKLVKEGDKDSRPDTTIERAWWDSLTGQNSVGNKVPDMNLSVNKRYGTSIRPRQSWYVDRFDALKEIIDYANTILKVNQLANTINFTNLDSFDPEPTKESLEWDASVETYAELIYINTKDLSGTVNYLVKADETINGFWAIYKWDGITWMRTTVQTYKTSAYYSYIDWYKTGTTIDTTIDKQITYQYELDSLSVAVGSHAKVTSADTSGWKLFKYTATGWENVATENGTIKLSTKLYDYSLDDTGFAGDDTFDENLFDQEPTLETRKILTALRDDIFTGDLKLYYNTLFFTGLRKVLSEQTFVDWMFKTSFVNIKSSVRALAQRKTYTTGKDAYVESYIKEVKPFHTKLREYKLGYTSTDTQDGINTDFDNPPFYDADESKIRSINTSSDTTKLTEYPWRMWNDYYKKHVASITVTSAGSGYTTAPTVTILGGTTGSTGPFQIYDTAASGVSSGSLGYYYPLYTSEAQAKIADSQNSGAGTVREFTFVNYTGTFYQPTSHTTYNQVAKSGTYKMYTTPNTTQATATAVIQNGSVTKITVTGIGANYTSTPIILITGGGTDGATPASPAKAYANLNNDLARDFDMTMRFDRISSTTSVVDWIASTSYAYGQLIRYNNELYKTTKALTTGTTFSNNNLYKFTGAERKLTAADRIKGMYTPISGMPGIELSQLMDGVDYGGTMVTGLLFAEGQGWDRQGWYDFPWDNYGKSNTLTWYGDGSTRAFEFATAPAVGDVYTTYFDGVRQTGEVFNGDGTVTSFALSITPGDGVKVELIKFDEDKVLTPTDDRTLDSIVKGGLFKSALGTAPSDIIMEGDDFISPETSYAPEESVPGQLFDTLDIKVYTSPESGIPFIIRKNYIGDANTTTFSMGQYPGTLGSVIVTVDKVVKKITADYTINVKNQTITFGTAPVTDAVISIRSFAISGENYRVLDTYTGDGSTVEFTTTTRENFNLDSSNSQTYITIDGVPTSSYTTTSTANTIVVTFNLAPTANSLIQIAGFNQTTATRAYASIRNENLIYNLGSTGYWTQTTALESNLKKNYKFTSNSTPTATNNWTASCWFRGSDSEFDSVWPNATETTYLVDNFNNENNGAFLLILEGTQAIYGARLQAVVYQGNGAGPVNMLAQPGGSAAFAANYLDGKWHHVFMQWRGDVTGSDATNQNRIYIDGVDVTTSAISNLTGLEGTAVVATKTSFAGDGTDLRESLIDIADVWVDFGTSTDWRSNRTWWYDNGYVDLGSDGTSGGAPQPDLWITETSGAVTQGGSFAGTVGTEGDTNGVVTVHQTNGPAGSAGSNRYTLAYPPGAVGPYSGLTIIEVNGKVLRGPDNTYYDGDGSTYTYGVVTGLLDDSTVDPSKTITAASQVQVFVNGTEKNLNTHYTVDVGNQNIEFVTDSVPTATDVICISTLVDNHYYNEGTDIIINPSAITGDGYTLSASNVLSVTTFNNALGMKQRREVLEGTTTGILNLRFDPLSSDYVFVWVNGQALTHNYDYTISGTAITVVSQTLTSTDRIDVMYFAGESNKGATGFRIFKDMLNRTFYKRISSLTTTQLDQDLFESDKTITVVDGSVLPEADGSTNAPAVIFIDKERIEYLERTANVLSLLRRGTLGTGIKVHRGGTNVVDASLTQTVPYADTVYTDTATGDGSTVAFTTTQTITSASQLDIFIGGQRLLLTSEDGSTINYSASGTTVTLSTAVASGTQVKILHKKGQVWYTALDGNPADGRGLQASTTQQAQFIGEEPTNAPE